MIKIYEYGKVANEDIFARVEPEFDVEAVVSDIIAAANKGAKTEATTSWHHATEGEIMDADEFKFSYYVRIKTDSVTDTLEAARNIFGSITPLEGSPAGCVEYFTAEIADGEAKRIFEQNALCGEIESRIRVLK